MAGATEPGYSMDHRRHLQPARSAATQILNRGLPFLPSSSACAAFDRRSFPGESVSGEYEKGEGEEKVPVPEPNLKAVNGTIDHTVEGCQLVIEKEQKQGVREFVPPRTSVTGFKRHRNPKPARNKRVVQCDPGPSDGNPASALSTCRYDSSLGLLTKKFINLLQHAEDGTLDLNNAAEALDVQKRRIYDITNVLEGVGLIEKQLKNRIRWKGFDMSRPKEMGAEVAGLKDELQTLESEDCKLDAQISNMQENLRFLIEEEQDENNHKWLYLTKEDISSLPSFQNSTLIAIKAPHGTSLEVPNPDEGLEFQQRPYQMLVRSSMGPIDCYLISNHEERHEASNLDHQFAEMDLSVQNSCTSVNYMTAPHQGEGVIFPTADQEQDKAHKSRLLDTNISRDTVASILKITPLNDDSDYWLFSDDGFSLLDSWTTA